MLLMHDCPSACHVDKRLSRHQHFGTFCTDVQEAHRDCPAALSCVTAADKVLKPTMCLKNAGMNVSSMLRDLGHVLEFSNSKQAAVTNGQQHARQTGTEEKSIAATARRLLSFSCQVGWAAVSELLLPIASAMAATASELVADLERICDEGLTLLHHVVRSRNASLVSMPVLLSDLSADLRSPGHDAHLLMDLLLSKRHTAFIGIAVVSYSHIPSVVPITGTACIPVSAHQS